MSSLLLIATTLACRLTEPVVITVEPEVVTVEVIVVVTATPTPEPPPPPPQPEQVIIFQDEFNGTSLDTSRWTFGTNSSGSGYEVADDILRIWGGTTNGGGGWVLSNQLFTPGSNTQTFETRARSSNADGGSWGFWGDDHEGYLLFGVSESGLLQAWVRADRNAPLQSITLNGIDITQWHDYKIEFSSTEARFYVDGVLVAVHTVDIPAGKPMHIRLDRVSWGQVEAIYLDYVRVSGQE